MFSFYRFDDKHDKVSTFGKMTSHIQNTNNKIISNKETNLKLFKAK